MFKTEIYVERRGKLKKALSPGMYIFQGNPESPMNYADNPFRYRQDSTFIYYFGIDAPNLTAVIDLDNDREIIFGDDLTVEQIIWMGSQPSLHEKCDNVGSKECFPANKLHDFVQNALNKNQPIHFLPQYRAENKIFFANILSQSVAQIEKNSSVEFAKAVIAQRSVKSDLEISEIEKALEVSYDMHVHAMRHSKPGVVEQEIAGAIEGIALSGGGYVSYPVIFSVDGQTLHNHYHGNVMQAGDIIVNDSGAAVASHYASDITRTLPVSGKFTPEQKDMYNIVLEALDSANAMIAPGVRFKDIHLHACKILAAGLKDKGLMKGDLDEAIQAGAHALFFQCGTGHMMGLDVHDMEDLGEQYVGYDEEIQRSTQFGLISLRLGKKLQPGFVVTVEPGLYFIPELIDMWRAENKYAEFINYDAVEKYRDFGGIRIEDNLVVTQSGQRILGRPIPKTVADVEAVCAS